MTPSPSDTPPSRPGPAGPPGDEPRARRWILARGHAGGWLAAVVGGVVIALLVRRVGAGALLTHLQRLGWRAVPVFLLESPRIFVADALAWWILLGYRKPRGVSYARLAAASLAGYAITNGTPLTDAGGEVLKAALIAAYVGESVAAAASIAFAGMFAVYASLGMVVLSVGSLFVPAAPPWVRATALGASSAMVVGGAGFLALLHVRDPASRVTRLLGALPVLSPFARRLESLAAGSDTELRALLAQRRRVALAGLVFVAVRTFQGVDAWILLHLLGAEATLAEAFLLQGWDLVSTLVFVWLPGQLGSMESTTLVLFSALGRDPSLAVAYELTRHLRLVAWVTLGFGAIVVLTRGRRPPLEARR
jgi:glycosyltransferase 2 family protein